MVNLANSKIDTAIMQGSSSMVWYNNVYTIMRGHRHCLFCIKGNARASISGINYSVKIDKNDDKMLEFYKEFITNIGIIQAPHHGARNDNPESLYKRLNGPVSVLSYGVGNNYGHPHPIAVCQIVLANSQIVPVSKRGETFIVSTEI